MSLVSKPEPSKFELCALASGLLTEQQLDAARAGGRWSEGEASEDAVPPSDEQLAERLVELGWLNVWQSKQLLDGRTKFNLGPYWIVDSIGQGGMGQVFKAEHSVMGRVVAIKVLPLSKSTPEAVNNFMREIRVLASLNHRNLVRAIDYGQDGNVHYLVTEYVPGCDLRKLVRREGPLTMQAAANIIYQVANGLRHAHQNGLIHRDVKPGNVLVSPDGEAKLSDLGLAGPVDGDAESDPRYGKIVGTADYLPPDHVESPWDPTPAWDIYSLGCTLYYAVTGKVPFPGGTTADKARAHCKLRPLDPRRLNKKLSDEFVDVLADMMAKDPAQRIPSAAAVMERLSPWTDLSRLAAPIIESPPSPLQLSSNVIGVPPPTAQAEPFHPSPPPGGSRPLASPPAPQLAMPPLATPPLARPPEPPPGSRPAGVPAKPPRLAMPPVAPPVKIPPNTGEIPSASAGSFYTRDTVAVLPRPEEEEEEGSENDSASVEVEISEMHAAAHADDRAASLFLPLVLILGPLMLVAATMAVWMMLKSFF
jgi:serine/threonine protein kinase